jgi:hypothetical protein
MKLADEVSQETDLNLMERFLTEQTRFLQTYTTGHHVQQQRVLAVTGTGSEVTVITNGSGPGQRRRYRLRHLDGDWKLIGTKLECSACSGNGTLQSGVPCTLCGAAGWTTV